MSNNLVKTTKLLDYHPSEELYLSSIFSHNLYLSQNIAKQCSLSSSLDKVIEILLAIKVLS